MLASPSALFFLWDRFCSSTSCIPAPMVTATLLFGMASLTDPCYTYSRDSKGREVDIDRFIRRGSGREPWMAR